MGLSASCSSLLFSAPSVRRHTVAETKHQSAHTSIQSHQPWSSYSSRLCASFRQQAPPSPCPMTATPTPPRTATPTGPSRSSSTSPPSSSTGAGRKRSWPWPAPAPAGPRGRSPPAPPRRPWAGAGGQQPGHAGGVLGVRAIQGQRTALGVSNSSFLISVVNDNDAFEYSGNTYLGWINQPMYSPWNCQQACGGLNATGVKCNSYNTCECPLTCPPVDLSTPLPPKTTFSNLGEREPQ